MSSKLASIALEIKVCQISWRDALTRRKTSTTTTWRGEQVEGESTPWDRDSEDIPACAEQS